MATLTSLTHSIICCFIWVELIFNPEHKGMRMEDVRILIADCTDDDPHHDKQVKKNISRVEDACGQFPRVKTEWVSMHQFPFEHRNARRTKHLSEGLEPLADMFHWAEVVLFATPVNWSGNSYWFKCLEDQVLSPLEEGGLKNGFECWGKSAFVFFEGDDGGAEAAGARIIYMLNHMGFIIPPWGVHYTLTAIPSGKTEDNWQRRPELLAPHIVEFARHMRNYPSHSALLKRIGIR